MMQVLRTARRLAVVLLLFLALLISVASVVMWARSESAFDFAAMSPRHRTDGLLQRDCIWSFGGAITLMRVVDQRIYGENRVSAHGPEAAAFATWLRSAADSSDPVCIPGLRFGYSQHSDGSSLRFVEVSYWLLCWPGPLLSVLWLVRLRASRRRNRLLCAACGYDLRATPAKCPECGAVPTHSPGSVGKTEN